MKIEYKFDCIMFDWKNPFYFTVIPSEITKTNFKEFILNLKLFSHEFENENIFGISESILSDTYLALKMWAYNCSQIDDLKNSVFVIGQKECLIENKNRKFIEIGLVDFDEKKGMKIIEVNTDRDNRIKTSIKHCCKLTVL